MWKIVSGPPKGLSYTSWIIGKLLERAELYTEGNITLVLILDVVTNL